VKSVNRKSRTIVLDVEASKLSPYVKGGVVRRHKFPKELHFKPLAEGLSAPGEFILTDYAKFEHPALLHVGFQAIDAFAVAHGHLPRPWNRADADEVIAHAKAVNAKSESGLESLREDMLRAMAYSATGDVSPMAAVFGGIVGQEVLKAASGKFHPIHQVPPPPSPIKPAVAVL
jgi:ubiquitin-activating enzyme E1